MSLPVFNMWCCGYDCILAYVFSTGLLSNMWSLVQIGMRKLFLYNLVACSCQCWDPQMKSIIVDFKMNSALSSVSQNSPFLTPRCKIQVWATIGQSDRPPADQVVKTPEHSLFALSHSTPSTSSTLDLRGLLSTSPLRAACPQDLLFWAQQAVESCKLHWQQAQRTSPNCSDSRSRQSKDLRNTKQVSTELLSLLRKWVTSFLICQLSSNLAQQEQHSTLEPQPSPATTSTFSSKTGNVQLGLDSIARLRMM